jgi:hypothetical protein
MPHADSSGPVVVLNAGRKPIAVSLYASHGLPAPTDALSRRAYNRTPPLLSILSLEPGQVLFVKPKPSQNRSLLLSTSYMSPSDQWAVVMTSARELPSFEPWRETISKRLALRDPYGTLSADKSSKKQAKWARTAVGEPSGSEENADNEGKRRRLA